MKISCRLVPALFLSVCLCESSCLDLGAYTEDVLDFAKSAAKFAQADPQPIVWTTCPEGFLSECTKMPVPLRWEQGDGPRIEIMISRQRSTLGSKSNGQVWLVQHGPGLAAAKIGPTVEQEFPELFAQFDLYVFQYRGTGDSTKMECPLQSAPESPGGASFTFEEGADCVRHIDAT